MHCLGILLSNLKCVACFNYKIYTLTCLREAIRNVGPSHSGVSSGRCEACAGFGTLALLDLAQSSHPELRKSLSHDSAHIESIFDNSFEVSWSAVLATSAVAGNHAKAMRSGEC